jgi:hypothetical protein
MTKHYGWCHSNDRHLYDCRGAIPMIEQVAWNKSSTVRSNLKREEAQEL